MVKVQVGTTFLPVRLTPRISGLAVLVSQIKNVYSALYVSDALTPISFVMEYTPDGGGTPQTITWNPALSTDSQVYFPVPDAFYSAVETWIVVFYWTITNGPSTEKIYTENYLTIQVLDLHNAPG